MPFTPEETQLILRAISEDKPFRTEFSKVADTIIDKIYSFFTNPNCSCKSAIIDWINKNEEATRQLINTFSTTFDTLKNTQQTQPIQQPHISPPQPITTPTLPIQPPSNVKIGETLVIDPTPEAYKNMFDIIKKDHWVFRGLQVIPGEDNGKDVWFILFY